jgi:hypothetical protein
MYIILNWKFDKKKMLPPLAHRQSNEGIGTKTPGGGVQTQQSRKKLLITNIIPWPQASHQALKKNSSWAGHWLNFQTTKAQALHLYQRQIENK